MDPKPQWRVASGCTDNDLVFDDQWRERDGITDKPSAGGIERIRNDRVPKESAGARIDREQMRVQRSEKECMVEDSEPTIHPSAANNDVGSYSRIAVNFRLTRRLPESPARNLASGIASVITC